MESSLEKVKLFVFDVDGTLILGTQPLPFAKQVLERLTSEHIDFVILSNNSSYSVKGNKERLEIVLDLQLSMSNIYTSTQASIDYLLKNKMLNCYLIGTPSMIEDFEKKGIKSTSENPQAIILGFDKTLDYEKIQTAALLLQQKDKIPFFATHLDDTCPIDNGRIPDVGSFLKMFEQATGRTADLVFGKPSNLILDLVLKQKNFAKSEVLVVGDRLETDIKMAVNSGVKSALVLTGETKEKDLSNSEFRPDFVWKNLETLYNYLNDKN